MVTLCVKVGMGGNADITLVGAKAFLRPSTLALEVSCSGEFVCRNGKKRSAEILVESGVILSSFGF